MRLKCSPSLLLLVANERAMNETLFHRAIAFKTIYISLGPNADHCLIMEVDSLGRCQC